MASLRPCTALCRRTLVSCRMHSAALCKARATVAAPLASTVRMFTCAPKTQQQRQVQTHIRAHVNHSAACSGLRVRRVSRSLCSSAAGAAASSSSSMPTPKVPMDLLKQLRGESGAPLGDVKDALAQAWADHGDFDLTAARENLRKKGLATAAKRAGKEATEGLVGLARTEDGATGVLVEVTAETDFVARSDRFQELVGTVTRALLAQVTENKSAFAAGNSISADVINDMPTEKSGVSVADAIADAVALLKENIKVGRASVLSVAQPGQGVVAGYMHNQTSPEHQSAHLSIGKHGALVCLNTSNTSGGAAAEFGQKLAMHIVAASPSYLTANSVPEDVLAHEKKLLKEEIMAATPNKPANVVDKIITGRVNKYFGEHVLLEQAYMLDDMQDASSPQGKNTTVNAVLKNVAKSWGTPVDIASFARVHVGN